MTPVEFIAKWRVVELNRALTPSRTAPMIPVMLRIVSGCTCILAGAVYAVFAVLLMSVISFSHPFAPLLAVVLAAPAVFYFALARYAMRRD
ncbi:MAG: hypothetical protein OXE53_10185 [Deltaproteobacteria bacterium]|nr:hypothetical protein [Deltaproteobacteria bacterium]